MNLQSHTLFRPMFISCIIFTISACGDGESPQSEKKPPAAAKSEMPAESAPMTGAKTAMPEQGAPMEQPMQEPQQAPSVLENGVIYQDEIYKNWPYTEAAGTGMPEQGASMEPQATPSVLENGVVYQDEIYKNWPYTEAPPVTAETPVTEMVEKKVEEVKTMAEEQATAVKQKMEAGAATAAATAATAATAAAATAGNAPAGSAAVDGGQIYNTYCAICHKLGMNAAPKYGNKALWAKRIAQGRETMYSHAINGLRGMPPRGGFAQLTDEEIKAGVDYMVRAAGGWGDK